ncbi:stress response protein nst1-like isoform X2 [Malania oleifera]|uniref:stress response protein nst1-like isoform X2 n=1 Tax=Malania oleifera TaxID=397392 RepID=UPI0025AEA7F4|nr:stress response protein nst1-like isoform X2 [Malania oleifera]
MCILCVIQKWSRRVATMLPWLVIPLIGLWALSQLLPPAFRFEITSPRLACVFVLLVTLFWYEILMPQLSAWRVRRNARLRERERLEAIEFDKLRKTATRRCRNCLTPYRDQNPGGGRFMCSYCGHISKRPVLDLPVPPGMRITNAGIIKDLVGKGGKIPGGKMWSDNGWICGQDWLENGNWVGGSFVGKSSSWRKNAGGFFVGNNQCLAEKSYSGVVFSACKLLTSFFLSIRWLWRKIFRVSTSRDDASSDAERRGMLAKRPENGVNFHESRGEKARRKAEEKRQARIEKELLEEEERKQREEVARLVEERRRLRDAKLEAEKDRSKGSAHAKEKDNRKEAEKKRQERKKEKDKGSSKSNSDAEELEKKACKESEKKREFERKSEIDRQENQRIGTENVKGHGTETGHGSKSITTNSYNRGNAGTRYLDRMRGTFLSPSKAFSGGSFFGKGASTAATVLKESKANGFIDHVQASANRRDLCPPDRVAGKLNMNGDDKNIPRPVLSEPQPITAPRKSWQQLFRSSAVAPSSNVNVISRPNVKFQAEVQSPQLGGQPSLTQSYDNPINFGLPSPFTLPTFPSGSSSSTAGFPSAADSIFPRVGEAPCNFLPEDPDIFEDPCYDPDPVSLLGPVSESLDNFQLDLGAGFVRDIGFERPHALKNIAASSEANRPSPIESPISRLRASDERQAHSNRFQNTPKSQHVHPFSMDDSCNGNDKGTWQMWNTSPLGQDGLGLVSGTASWLLSPPPESNRSNKEDIVHSQSHKTMASLFAKEDQVLPGSHSPQNIFLSNGQNNGMFSPVTGSSDHDPWLQNTFFQPLSGGENPFSLNPQEETAQNEVVYGSPSGSVASHPFDLSPGNCWSKKEWAVQGSGEGAVGNSSVTRPHIGGLYSTPDVQSLWSYD